MTKQSFLNRFICKRPRLDAALSALDKKRLKLAQISLARLFPDFSTQPVQFFEVPIGPWSSHVKDVLMLSKVVLCAKPRRILEVGSFRGYTALSMARHMPDNARVVTVDRDPRHGEAYRNSEWTSRIERRVGEVRKEMFEQDGKETFDLIFLDAGHRYHEVKRDSEILLPLLSNNGYMLWHDYENWGKFSGDNGVPEYLHELAASKSKTVLHVCGSNLAMYSPAWNAQPSTVDVSSFVVSSETSADPWTSDITR